MSQPKAQPRRFQTLRERHFDFPQPTDELVARHWCDQYGLTFLRMDGSRMVVVDWSDSDDMTAAQLMGRVAMLNAVFDCGDERTPPTPRDSRKLFTLVRMVQSRLNRGQHETGPVAFEIQALTWALESLGYPPSRYAEVINECAPAKVKDKRRSRPHREET